jgi:hypothetical protein
MSDEGDDPTSNSNIVDLSDEYITVEDLVLSVQRYKIFMPHLTITHVRFKCYTLSMKLCA